MFVLQMFSAGGGTKSIGTKFPCPIPVKRTMHRFTTLHGS